MSDETSKGAKKSADESVDANDGKVKKIIANEEDLAFRVIKIGQSAADAQIQVDDTVIENKKLGIMDYVNYYKEKFSKITLEIN